ncbi:MAG: glycerol-3-phosphate 1-O-acyltransferase PlsY [Magnetococcales bacterium]|nr:glycerol-3-phosphate 1-O-acyltransferase PlsY [Magnetococcales bacterium]
MVNDPLIISLVVASYLIGAIPFGLLVAKTMGGVDIRTIGSGNIGATNVLRAVGKKAGATALLLDIGKGAVPVIIAKTLYGTENIITLYCALAAFFGHLYPIYLGFKGGKGVATALGIVAAWVPIAGAITLFIWIAMAKTFKYSSLAALTAFATLPFMLFFLEEPTPMSASYVLTILIYWRHRANIQRLIAGIEPCIGQKSESS